MLSGYSLLMMNIRHVSHTELFTRVNWDNTGKEESESEESAQLVNIGLRY